MRTFPCGRCGLLQEFESLACVRCGTQQGFEWEPRALVPDPPASPNVSNERRTALLQELAFLDD